MVEPANIRNAKILIVDNQPANVMLLGRILDGAGYSSVSSTMNPREVCELHRKNRYDLILLDLRMPGMDGFDVMEGLKEFVPADDLPVLIITAHPDDKSRALKAGAKDFTARPFDHAEVLTHVRSMLEASMQKRSSGGAATGG